LGLSVAEFGAADDPAGVADEPADDEPADGALDDDSGDDPDGVDPAEVPLAGGFDLPCSDSANLPAWLETDSATDAAPALTLSTADGRAPCSP